jgi:V8-like Glu-specific endopeptidase
MVRYLAVLLVCFTGCVNDLGDEDVYSTGEGVIIGNNDLVAVARDGSNVPGRYRSILDGFGRLHVNGALCTATHVGGGVVITAGHCFSAPDRRVNDRPCGNTSVEWGYRGGGVTSHSNCTRILAMQTGNGLDYAIFRVSPVPAVTVGVSLDQQVRQGESLTIFSHADGSPLRWSRVCPVKDTSSTQFRYPCDTLGGSSGASVLRDGTLAVVGIHWGGGGDANAATKLSATPLGEFLSARPPAGDELVSRASGKCLDVSGNGTTDGTPIQLWSCNGTGAQSFDVRDAGGGRVNLVHSASGKCVDIANSGTADGTRVQLWSCNGTGAQSFELRDAGGGNLSLVNGTSGKCLDVQGNRSADGTPVILWSCQAGAANQEWTRR